MLITGMLPNNLISGLLQRDHPGTAISVKTRNAIRTLLYISKDAIVHLSSGTNLQFFKNHYQLYFRAQWKVLILRNFNFELKKKIFFQMNLL